MLVSGLVKKIDDSFDDNDFYDMAREVAGDLIEEVRCIDTFYNKKLDRTSKAFRINYRSLDRTLTNKEIDELQFRLRDRLTLEMKLELR